MSINDVVQGDAATPITIEGAEKVSIIVSNTINKILRNDSSEPEASSSNTINKRLRIDSSEPEASGTFERHNYLSCGHKNEKNSKVIKRNLQQLYLKYTLPKVAWLDRGLDLSLDKYFVDLEMSENNKLIKMQDIFKDEEGKKPLRLLVEGQPGYGKTTMAVKLAFDWANQRKYMEFKLVFFVHLRELGRQNIEDAIVEIGNRCNVNKNDIMDLIDHYQNETLFILDGLDEILPETRKEIMKILHKQKFEKVTIIVFCRTGFFQLSKNERIQLFGMPNVKEDFSDKRISILGIRNENKQLFLENFCSDETVDKILNCVSLELELFDSPLFLMLLPIIVNDDTKEFSTQTSLYKHLFNSVIKHSYINRKQQVEDSFDLFCFDGRKIHSIQHIMYEFGKLCVKKFAEGKLIFENDNLTDEVYKLGFLAKQSQTTLFESKIYYEAFHLSLIEFACAFGLCVALKFNKSEELQVLLKLIMIKFFESKRTSLTIKFLMGLVDDDLDHLLSHMQSFQCVFKLDFDCAVCLFSECSPINISKSNRLKDFFPSRIEFPFRRDYVKNDDIIWNHLLTSDHIEHMLIDLEDLEQYLHILTKFTGCLVICHTEPDFTFTVYCKVPVDTWELLSKITNINIESLLLFASLPTVKFSFIKWSFTFMAVELVNAFVQIVSSNNIYKTIGFLNLSFPINNCMVKNFIITLIKNNQIRALEFSSELLDIDDLICAVGKSSYLSSITINTEKDIDLSDLTNGGKKNYSYMFLQVPMVKCRKKLSNKNVCDHLTLHNTELILNALTEIEPFEFSCFSSEEFNAIVMANPSWRSLQTVKTLHLSYINEPLIECALKNLQILHLKDLRDGEEIEIVKRIQNSQITRLIITSELFKKICMQLCSKKCNLKIIDIICDGLDEVKMKELELLKGLKLKIWDQINLVFLRFFRVIRPFDFINTEDLFDLCVNHCHYDSIAPKNFVMALLYYLYEFSEHDHIFTITIPALCITRKE